MLWLRNKSKKSKDNANADTFSWLPSLDKYKNLDEVDIFEIDTIENLPVTLDELRKHTEYEREVALLLESLKDGRFGFSQTDFTLQQGC